MGVLWIKALTLTSGHANVIKHLDRVLDCSRRGSWTRRRSSPTT